MHVLQQGFQLHRTNPQAALAQQRQNQQYQAQQQAQLQRSIREGIANPVSQDSAFIGQQQAGYSMVSMPHPSGGGGAGAGYSGASGAPPGSAQVQASQQQVGAAGGTESGRDRIAPTQQQQTNLDDFETFAKQGPTPEISSQASQYFQPIYKGQIPIGDAINLLQKMRASSSKQENDVFMCMVLNLFDEYCFFGRYPKKELEISGILFGSLIDLRLLSGKTLLFAMRLVLESLNKDPKTPGAAGASLQNFFNFGVVALSHLRSRLVEMPRYCRDVTTIPHFSRECPELHRELLLILELCCAIRVLRK